MVPALELGRGRGRDRGAGARRQGRALDAPPTGSRSSCSSAPGLAAGLLGQIAEALSSDTLERVSTIASWVLPFEALYQSALQAITADTFGFTRFAIDLGPFGGAQTFGAWLCAVHGRLPGGTWRGRAVGLPQARPLTLGSVQRMIAVENITDWRGQDVVDPAGEKLGKLEEVYFDGETDDATSSSPSSPARFSKSLTLVPLAQGHRRPRLHPRRPRQERVQEGTELRHRRRAHARRRGRDLQALRPRVHARRRRRPAAGETLIRGLSRT